MSQNQTTGRIFTVYDSKCYWSMPDGSNRCITSEDARTINDALSTDKTTAPDARLDDDGALDEVVAVGCDFHLEQLGGNMWWMSVSSGGRTIHITLSTKSEQIKASVTND